MRGYVNNMYNLGPLQQLKAPLWQYIVEAEHALLDSLKKRY
jgi:hypothetical protein